MKKDRECLATAQVLEFCRSHWIEPDPNPCNTTPSNRHYWLQFFASSFKTSKQSNVMFLKFHVSLLKVAFFLNKKAPAPTAMRDHMQVPRMQVPKAFCKCVRKKWEDGKKCGDR